MMKFQVLSDKSTVWVNGPKGYCYGRFGRFGIDIHKPPSEDSSSECIYCTHGQVNESHWKEFKDGMLKFHGIKVNDSHKPLYLI